MTPQYIWTSLREKPVFGGLQTTKVQTSLRRCALISAFVIRFFESTISKLATNESSIFKLVYWFESRFVGKSEDRFSRDAANKMEHPGLLLENVCQGSYR